jgi:hypothetical protein
MTRSLHGAKTDAEAHDRVHAYIDAFRDAGVTDPQRISDLTWASEAYFAERLRGAGAAPPPDGLRTPAEAARKLGCSTKTLLGHVASGALHYVDLGHGKKRPRYRFTDADLDEFIANRTRKDSPTCRSDATRARRSTHTTFKSEVVAFTARPNARTSGKRKR